MKVFNLSFIVLFFFFALKPSYAQNCGFDAQRQKQRLDPYFSELQNKAEKKIQDAIKNKDLSKSNTTVITIPIVVHVLHLGESEGIGINISQAQIQSSIDNLNDYYRGQIPTSSVDFEIEFALAQRDPNCIATNGIIRVDASGLPGYANNGVNVRNSNGASYEDIVALSSWPQTDYLNIWIVSELDNNNGGFGFQGYAYFYNETFSSHGSVMMSSVFGYDLGNTNGWGLNSNGDNSTVVHEVGHFFHLYHTFQGDDTNNDGISDACPADLAIGTNSDGCADTVPHRRETSTCPSINSCTGNPWVDNNTINNIMGYYSCSDRLTADQKLRARAAMEDSALANSKGHLPVDPNYSAPSVVCAPNSTSTFNSGILSVALNGTTYNSFSSGSDGGNIDNTSSCSNYFEVDPIESNILNVGMYTVNVQQLGVWIDWNDDGDFDDEEERQYLQNDITEGSNISITLTFPGSIPYGDYVRIRLITEVDDRYNGIDLITSPCATNLVTGQSEDYTIFIKPEPVTYAFDGTWSPISPENTSTERDHVVIHSGSVNFIDTLNCNTLTVNPGASLRIDASATISAQTINLNSTSQLFSSLIVDGPISGTVNYNRYVGLVGTSGTNDLIAAPLSGQSFGDFASANTNLAASGNLRAFAAYNTATGSFENYDIILNESTPITSGIGFRAGTIDGSTVRFTGTPNSEDITGVPISDATSGSAWNLIGNPFPSYIDFATFFELNKSQLDPASNHQAIYGYDGDISNGWTVWNQATITEGSITELIAPGQGFFVKAKPGGGLVDFTKAMRTSGTSDDFLAGRSNNQNTALLKLNMSHGSNNASTQIYFIEGTTRGLDVGYDAGVYSSGELEFSIVSNLVEDNAGIDMAIQSLPFEDLYGVVMIPLGIKATAMSQITIQIDELSTLPENVMVYLEDTKTNSFTMLNESSYVFTPTEDLNGPGRFFLRFEAPVLNLESSEIERLVIYSSDRPKNIVIKGLLTETTKATLYDSLGRSVLSKDLSLGTYSQSIGTSHLETGVYLVQLSNKNGSLTQKLIVK